MDKKSTLPLPSFLLKPVEDHSNSKADIKSHKVDIMPGLVSTGFNSQPKSSGKKQFHAPPTALERKLPNQKNTYRPHFSSPQGMLMPSHLQPPPMYGPRGPTIPPKYMNYYQNHDKNQDHRKHWCEPCDKEFSCLQDLEFHKSEHKTCGIDGCSFISNPEVLVKHIEDTHNSGLYKKIKKLSTPEEIARWRDERRKRYPTIANVELRQKVQMERMKRGEKIDKKKNRFGDKQDRRQIRDQEGQKEVLRRRGENNNVKLKKKVCEKKINKIKCEPIKEEENEEEFNGKLQRFKGTSKMENYFRPTTKAVKTNPLANLLGMYGSDEESDDESDESESDHFENCVEDKTKSITPESCTDKDESLQSAIALTQINKDENEDISSQNKDSSPEHIHDKKHLLSKNDGRNEDIPIDTPAISSLERSKEHSECNSTKESSESDEEMPEEVPIQKIKENFTQESAEPEEVPIQKIKHDLIQASTKGEANTNISKDDSKKRFRRRKRDKADDNELPTKKPKTGLLNYSKLRTCRQNTMLEKLLEPDIRHERNVLLQCVRFVVENNFFGIGSKKCP